MLNIHSPSELELMEQAHRALRQRIAASPPASSCSGRCRQSRRRFNRSCAGTRSAPASARCKPATASASMSGRAMRGRKRPAPTCPSCRRGSKRPQPDRRRAAACAQARRRSIYRQNREGRFTEITVTYLMNGAAPLAAHDPALPAPAGTRGLYRHEVVRGARSRLCTGLLIALRAPLFARHHKAGWPCKLRNPGASKESQNNRTLDSRGKGERLSVRQWSLLCMDGVFRAFMKTDPLGLMKTTAAPDGLPVPISASPSASALREIPEYGLQGESVAGPERYVYYLRAGRDRKGLLWTHEGP